MNKNLTVYNIYICGDLPTNESQGELKGEFACKPRGISGTSPLKSDGSQNILTGRLGRMSDCPKQLKGGHQARVRSDQILVMAKQVGWIT